MGIAFSPGCPCCGCCGPFNSTAYEWDTTVPGSFTDQLCMLSGSLVGLITFRAPTTNADSCFAVNPGVNNNSLCYCGPYCIDNCLGGPACYTAVAAFEEISIASYKVGDKIEFQFVGFSLSVDPNYVYPIPKLSYTVQNDGCAIVLKCGAESANSPEGNGSTVVNLGWSESLWVLDGLQQEDLSLGKEYTIPNRDINGSGLFCSTICGEFRPPFGDGNYTCTYPPPITGSFSASPAKLTIHAPP